MTYVESGVGAHKGEGITHHTNHERHAVGRPTTIVNKSGEHIRSTSMRSKGNKRDKNGEETQNVEDQDESLKLGQYGADEGIDEDSEQEDSPE